MSDDQSFAALFEAQSKGQTMHRSVRVGEVVEGLVVHVGAETIFVELDGKRQAMLEAVEVRAEDGTIALKIGDTVRAKVVSVDQNSGDVRLGYSFGKSGDLGQIQRAMESEIAITGKVTGSNKGGIEVDLGKGVRGFCPLSQVAQRPGTDIPGLMGQSLEFLVTEIKDGGRGVVLSRRKLLDAQGRESRERVLATLEKGKTVRGTVTAVRDFGAFVDLGGVEGLIPASELSHERGVKPTERLQPGEEVEAQVLEIKDEEPSAKSPKGQKRITLSLKALVEAPARPAPKPSAGGAGLAIGAIVKGKVARIETYGVFVQVDGTEGREGRGLIPAAELDVARGVDLRKAFPEGTELTAKVLETGGGKLKLSVRRAKDDAERAEFNAHREKSNEKGLGTFADLLKKRK